MMTVEVQEVPVEVRVRLSFEFRERHSVQTGQYAPESATLKTTLSALPGEIRERLIQDFGFGCSIQAELSGRSFKDLLEVLPLQNVLDRSDYFERERWRKQLVAYETEVDETIPGWSIFAIDRIPEPDEVVSLLAAYFAKIDQIMEFVTPRKAALWVLGKETAERNQQWRQEQQKQREQQEQEKRALEDKRQAEKMAAEAIAKEAAAVAKKAWCLQHGSDRLRRCIELDYSGHRLYVQERAAFEFPGYAVDFKDKCEWVDRSCPSTAALQIEDAARENPHFGNATMSVWTVWLKQHLKSSDYDFEPCEAVIICKFLAKYDLVQIV